jgi:hypothetical protein
LKKSPAVQIALYCFRMSYWQQYSVDGVVEE